MPKKPDVVFVAPGAGLGHLVRTCSIVQSLGSLGITSRIVSNSKFSWGMALLAGCEIDVIPGRAWVSKVRSHVYSIGANLLILDTFPFGIRGEWLEELRQPFVYIARRLNIEEYAKVISSGRKAGIGESGAEGSGSISGFQDSCPGFERVIKVEPLSETQEYWLKKKGGDVVGLSSPVRFWSRPGIPFSRMSVTQVYSRMRVGLDVTNQMYAGESNPPISRDLKSFMDGSPVCLIVHSGPEEEIKMLVEIAEGEKKSRNINYKIGVISPEPFANPSVKWFEYFPASELFARVDLIITGGGYNSVAESLLFRDKHVMIPFERRFDDQLGRLKSMKSDVFWTAHPESVGTASLQNGAIEAAAKIRFWLD